MKTIERIRTEKDANNFSNTFWNDQNAIDSSVNQQQGEKEDSQSIRYWTTLTAYQLVILQTIQKVQGAIQKVCHRPRGEGDQVK